LPYLNGIRYEQNRLFSWVAPSAATLESGNIIRNKSKGSDSDSKQNAKIPNKIPSPPQNALESSMRDSDEN
jgi:hypothetical protein